MSSSRLMLSILLAAACSFVLIPACQANYKLYDAKTQLKVDAMEPWIHELVSKIKRSPSYAKLANQLGGTNVVWIFKVIPNGEFCTFENYVSRNTSKKQMIAKSILMGISMKAPPNDLAEKRGIILRIFKEKGKVNVLTQFGSDPHAKLAQIDPYP